MHSYVIGFCIEQQAVQPRPGEANDRYDARQRLEDLAANGLVLAAEAERWMFTDSDEQFEYGLRLIISGMAQRPAR